MRSETEEGRCPVVRALGKVKGKGGKGKGQGKQPPGLPVGL